MQVRAQAESGSKRVFTSAGASGASRDCSMCLGMNPDQLSPDSDALRRPTAISKAGRGKGGRTHLVSPAVAAATAVRGVVISGRPRKLATLRRIRWTHSTHRNRCPAAPIQCRHRPDHPCGLPEAGYPNGFRGRPFRWMAVRPVIRPQPQPVRQRLGFGCWPRLWDRIVTRAYRLGIDGLRLSRHLIAIRGYLPRQRG